MDLRALGRSGLAVSPIGLGLAALGRPGYIDLGRDSDLGADRSVEALERRCHAVLTAAYESGVRYVDAARSYGLAETFLASWLERRGLPADALTMGSKWGYTYTGGWQVDAEVHEVKDHSIGNLRRQAAESLQALDGWLDLYQIHSATLESGVLEDAAVLAELARLRSGGLTIGLSVSGPQQADVVRRALEIEVEGVHLFGVVQATWNVLEPSAGPALHEAHEAGWGVIVKEAVANGRLTPHGSGPEVATLRRLGAATGAPPDAIALAAALANPWADVVLSGAVTVDQLSSNLTALSVTLPPSDLAALASLAEPAADYWKTRSALSWS